MSNVVKIGIDEPEESPIWELSYERKKRETRYGNRIMLMVVAPSLSSAMATAEARFGEAWHCWSARHVGRRVVLGSTPPNGEAPKGGA